MFPAVAPHLDRVLAARDASLAFVDVGARSSSPRSPGTSTPSASSPTRTSTGSSKPARPNGALIGAVAPPFRSLRYFPYAIAAADGRSTFCVTRAAAASGLLPPNHERLREIRWKGRRYERNFDADVFEAVGTVEAETRTLASFARAAGVDHVDYLKTTSRAPSTTCWRERVSCSRASA